MSPILEKPSTLWHKVSNILPQRISYNRIKFHQKRWNKGIVWWWPSRDHLVSSFSYRSARLNKCPFVFILTAFKNFAYHFKAKTICNKNKFEDILLSTLLARTYKSKLRKHNRGAQESDYFRIFPVNTGPRPGVRWWLYETVARFY